MAHERRLVAPRVLGRERDRLGQGRHARAAARWATCRRPANGCGWRCRSTELKLAPGTVIDGWAFTQHGGTVYWDKAGIETRTPQDGQLFDSLDSLGPGPARPSGGAGCPTNLKAIVEVERSKRTEAQTKELPRLLHRACLFQDRAGDSSRLRAKLAEAEQKRKQIEEQIPTTLVFREKAGEPKPAFLLKRGEYDQRGEKVGRGVPAFLPPLPPGAPVNRLGLAQWLVAPNHPLTARVAVNRFWLQVFGTGIVKTAEDFGSQGEPPSHPELLDWLAVQFREDGWDVKRFMKRLVMSATYRQSSRVDARDRWRRTRPTGCSRAGRGSGSTPRCSATRRFIVSGLLVETVGGPSVKPPQPPGLWEAVGYTDSNTAQFNADTRRREGPSPQPLHLLEADLAAAADDDLRRPVARGLHGAPRADQHAAPGPPAHERAAVHRGLARRWPSGRLREAGRLEPSRRTATGLPCSGWSTGRRPDARELAELDVGPRATSRPITPASPTPPRS